MRYAIISDIHSNLEALDAVLKHIKSRRINRIICLGDVVGYGPDPQECLKIVRETADVCVKGNHEEAIIEGAYLFNDRAKASIEWTQKSLAEMGSGEINRQFLSDLPLSYTEDNYLFVHASPLDPTSDYIFGAKQTVKTEKYQNVFSAFDSILFIGHTHIPCVITEDLKTSYVDELGYKYHFQNQKAIINVGSVGQPRDKDNRASYLEVIDDMFFFHRIPYEMEKTRQKILANEYLDNYLGERLLLGK
ncbi:metallophosphoesterase [Candidatus Uabimicrobium sp. HlEnr_7]|uniref:metallophosphoesterase family protein n=1 Tax=Candidatus Uabimicrobium helgolandensis TaxID=3095367 RepID=UPI003555E3A5